MSSEPPHARDPDRTPGAAPRSFGEVLRELRLAAGLTQEELAERAELSARAIGGLERGRIRRPQRKTVGLLARALDLAEADAARLLAARPVPAQGAGGAGEARLRDGVTGAPAEETEPSGIEPAGAASDPPPPGSAAPGSTDQQATGPLPGRPEPPGRTAPPPPGELPADLADFVGRAGAVDRVAEVLSRADAGATAVPVCVVSGPGGVGKTTLAVHVAHLLRDRFPDGQLYVGLRGTGPTPLAPAEVLDRFLRTLGVDSVRVQTEEERAALFRSVLVGRRILIVLDDAATAAQVRPLIPGDPGSAVLVTSRNPIAALDGGERVVLDVLDDVEAGELLTRIVGAERVTADLVAASDVLRACAGLPLALRIAAVHAAGPAGWTLRALAEQLAGYQGLDLLTLEDRAVRATFSTGLAALSPSAARAFRVLSVWEGPSLSAAAVTALLVESGCTGAGRDTPAAHDAADSFAVPRAEAAVAELTAVGLLQEPEPGRYRFHDLVRAFADERAQADLPPGTADAAFEGLLTWFLHSVAATVPAFFPQRTTVDPIGTPPIPPQTFAGHAEALAWMEAEHAALVAAVEQAARRGLHELTWRLTLPQMAYFNIRKHWSSWITTHEIAVAGARAVGHVEGEHMVLSNLASAYRETARPEKAVQCLETVLDGPLARGSRHGLARTLTNLGMAYHVAGRPEAVPTMERALAVTRDMGDTFGEGLNLGNLAQALTESGRAAEALPYAEAGVETAARAGDPHSLSMALNHLCKLRIQLGDPAAALAVGERSLAVATEAGNRDTAAVAVREMGNAHRALGDREAARRRYREALARFETFDEYRAADVRGLLDGLGE